MKRAVISLICLMLGCAIALCEVNKTLLEAQSMYQSAKTEAEYVAAKKKFMSASTDPGYTAAEHDAAIKKGIKDCEAKIAQLSSRLTVTPTSISFGPEGGSATLSVSTNQGTPAVKPSQDWLKVESRSASAITLSCEPNSSAEARTATVTVSAGKLSVRVKASQEGAVPAASVAEVDSSVTKEQFDGIKFSRIEFGSFDDKGGQLTTFGSTLYKDKACLVKPRIYYKSPREMRKQVQVKAYKPDGSLWTLPDSPDGYTLADDALFKQGTSTLILSGLGWSTPLFDIGEYKYEVWVDGMLALESSFAIKPKQEGLQITDVQFGSTDFNNNWVSAPGKPLKSTEVQYISPQIYYTSSSHQKKNVYFKFYDSNGSLMKDKTSPKGYSHQELVEFKQGKSSYKCRGRRKEGNGKFTPGTYKVEIWIDGKCQWSGAYEIL